MFLVELDLGKVGHLMDVFRHVVGEHGQHFVFVVINLRFFPSQFGLVQSEEAASDLPPNCVSDSFVFFVLPGEER